jgi:chromate transporter
VNARHPSRRTVEVLGVALRLGLSSFGGPIAHLGYFERAYVQRRRWLSAQDFAGLVALCQLLPGPTSSQVGFLIGLRRAGWPGALAAWLGFTLPSALLLYACAVLTTRAPAAWLGPVLHGLKLTTVAIVAQAVWSMARNLCPDRPTAAIALLTAALLLVLGGPSMQLAALGAGALAGVLWCRGNVALPTHAPRLVGLRSAWVALALFALLLLGLPALATQHPHGPVALVGIFCRAGALVFGGGHVVLPLLRDALVPTGWISDDRFLAGYGFAQAVPGPLFALAAYLGAVSTPGPAAAVAATLALIGIFLPGLLIAVAGAALWEGLARHANVRAGLVGVNATVVGILGAALYDPVWTTAVIDGADVAIAIGGFALLQRWKLAPLAVVAVCVASSVLRNLL